MNATINLPQANGTHQAYTLREAPDANGGMAVGDIG
jgi:hypothetical protein